MTPTDPGAMAAAFSELGWNKPRSQFDTYLEEYRSGERHVLVVNVEGAFAGYVTLVRTSRYEPFAAAGIPEVSDLNVLPGFRRHGLGNALLAAAEALAGTRSDVVGLGVGLLADYGPAQRIYVRRGYVPDGRGIMYDEQPVGYAEHIPIDDDATLKFTLALR